jgi:hypothetical protein
MIERLEARIKDMERSRKRNSHTADVQVVRAMTSRTALITEVKKKTVNPSLLICNIQHLASEWTEPGARRVEPNTSEKLRLLASKVSEEFFDKAVPCSAETICTFVLRKLQAMDPTANRQSELDADFDKHVALQGKRRKDRDGNERTPAQTRASQDHRGGNGCPKCHGAHSLRDCQAQQAVNTDGSPNLNWHERPRGPRGNRRDQGRAMPLEDRARLPPPALHDRQGVRP